MAWTSSLRSEIEDTFQELEGCFTVDGEDSEDLTIFTLETEFCHSQVA